MTQIQLVKSTWEIQGLLRYLIFLLFVYFFSVICFLIVCLLFLEWKKLNTFLLILIRMRLKLKPERKNQPWVYFQIMFNRYVKFSLFLLKFSAPYNSKICFYIFRDLPIWYFLQRMTRNNGYIIWLWFLEVIQKLEQVCLHFFNCLFTFSVFLCLNFLKKTFFLEQLWSNLFKNWWKKMAILNLPFGDIHWWPIPKILLVPLWRLSLLKNFKMKHLSYSR